MAAVVTNADASLRWLSRDPSDLDEAREAIRRINRDGKRAGNVISRLRSLFKKIGAAKEQLDLNEVIEEVVILTESEARRNKVVLRKELAAQLPPVLGDRVQLQQVLVNLILNAIQAMAPVEDRERVLLLRTQPDEARQVRVTVQDSGIGFDPQNAERIFNAFHTTKATGMGMGLSISRSIVESHGGRLWAMLNDGPGAKFQFTEEVSNEYWCMSVADLWFRGGEGHDLQRRDYGRGVCQGRRARVDVQEDGHQRP